MDLEEAIKSGIAESFYMDVDPEMANRDRIQELRKRYQKLANIPKQYKSAKNEKPLHRLVILTPIIHHHLEVAHHNFINGMELLKDNEILEGLKKHNDEQLRDIVSQEMIMLILYKLKQDLDFIEEKLDELEAGLEEAYGF